MNTELIECQRDYLIAGLGIRTSILEHKGFDYAMFEVGNGSYWGDRFINGDDSLSVIFCDFVKDTKNVICLGKNFASFDLQFLKKTNIFNEVKLSSRSADIGVLFQMKDDETLPSMKTCMQRSGLDFPEGVTHDALQDAKDTAILYMEGLRRLNL